MAWNDPPTLEYQQRLFGSGRKVFKHRYVANDTKLGQQLFAPGLQNNQFTHNQPSIAQVDQQTNIFQQQQHYQQPQVTNFNQQSPSQTAQFQHNNQQQPYNNNNNNNGYSTNNLGQVTDYGTNGLNQTCQMLFNSPPPPPPQDFAAAPAPPYHSQQQ